ncbi:MAG: glycyl radical protein [Clostridiales bacterium]|nr:glycyl radical protein [Clostridiales bacterium]
MTERVSKLRQESLDTIPTLSIERALIVTDVYKEHEGKVSIPVLRALSFKAICERKTVIIYDGELIVGEKGHKAKSAPTYPELCCHTLEDFKVINDREKVFFKVDEETLKAQKEIIIPYWQGKSMRDKLFNYVAPEWVSCYEAGLYTEFMEQRGPGHTAGSRGIYEKGFAQRKREIEKAMETLDFCNDPEAAQKREQLAAMGICCDAIITLGKRYAAYARELAEAETDAGRRAELLQIAQNCDAVPAERPRTYWQALQMYWFVHIGVTTEINPWDAYSPGRLDQHLIGFYRQDLATGALDREAALELLECLWIKFNNQPAPPKVGITLKESSTYTDFANINTGGIDPTGEDGVNEVSMLILDCMDEMQLLQPSSNVQISRKTPSRFLLRACEIARKGWGQPAFYNTEAILQELLCAGKSIQDARKGGSSGCVETGAFGNEAYILTGYFNLPKILEITLHGGVDPVSGKQLGLPLGCAEDFSSYEELFDAYARQVAHFIEIKVRGSNLIEQLYAAYMPVPFLSVITNDCIAAGKDYNAGGARYNTSYLQGVGIGTITDSLAAIKYNVFDENRFTMGKLMDALAANFEGAEDVLYQVRNRTPKYGNDDEYADAIMRQVFTLYRDAVTGRPNARGGAWRVNMLPTTCHIYFGEVMLASPNGRFAHQPVSEGISPEKGADIHGPTAVIRSCAKMDQLSTGGALLNQKFTPGVVAGDAGLSQMANLIRAYFNLDGHHIQFNVVDRQTLLDAQAHPDEYRDLIVRVAGYSDHFRNLSRALQDEIIGRTEQTL